MPHNPQQPNDLRDDADAGGRAGVPPRIPFTVPGPDPVLGWAGLGVERLIPPPADLRLDGEGDGEDPRREPRQR
ncbi:MAG TPA: hypothetical protein VFJ82_20385 [Longimicrobium sp.]|nr:hypothetical protein [Longimicrobium sp.]